MPEELSITALSAAVALGDIYGLRQSLRGDYASTCSGLALDGTVSFEVVVADELGNLPAVRSITVARKGWLAPSSSANYAGSSSAVIVESRLPTGITGATGRGELVVKELVMSQRLI